MTAYACIMLPYPPTVNTMFPGRARRHKSAQYTVWIAEAEQALQHQKPLPRFEGPIEVRYSYGRPDKRQRDVFNLEKATSDFLKHAGIILDDSLIERGTVQWDSEVVGCRVEIIALDTVKAAGCQ